MEKLYYIYLFSMLPGAAISIKAFGPRWPRPYRYVSIFLLLTLCVEALAILWKWWLYKTPNGNYSISNLWIYNGFLPLRYLLLLAFFHGVIRSARLKAAIRWVSLPFLLFSLGNYFFIQGPHHADTYTIICCNTLMIALSVAFLYQREKYKYEVPTFQSADVWICVGIVIYHTGTLPLFVFFDYLLKYHLSMALSYFYINDALNIVMSICYLIAFLCRPST